MAQVADMAVDEAKSSKDIVVMGDIGYRDRTEAAAPTLEYNLDYFQPFEPLTVGDILKRTPSVAFVSDVLEYDGVQLRGLDPGYTQILINGEKVPGSGLDRSFFVDRIPAELVERVEIVRSPSANRSGDAVAGSLNIILRDALSLKGGYVRAGALRYDDDEVKGTLGGAYGGSIGAANFVIGANYQGRYNPKEKVSFRYFSPSAAFQNADGDPAGEFKDREDQSDTRDGDDYSFNASLNMPVGEGTLDLSGFYVKTERKEIENSVEYEALTFADADEWVEIPGITDIEQDNFSLGAKFKHPLGNGDVKVNVGFAQFKDNTTSGETEYAYEPDFAEAEGQLEHLKLTDEEWSAKLAYIYHIASDMELEFGADYTNKKRDTSLYEQELEYAAGDPIPPFGDLEAVAGGVNTIEETRLDPYVMLSGKSGALNWELGVRYETTDIDVADETAPAGFETTSTDYDEFLPSMSLKYSLTEDDRLLFSAGRTIRRPSFNYISPAQLEGEYGDLGFQGDPTLEAEKAWGVDVGYERRLGKKGVMGINFFYRDVQDLIEVYNTGTQFEGEDLLSVRNTGDGQVYGVELDLSTPLSAFGLPNTGVFFNYSWLDSSIDDEFGDRRFNNQADYVLNAGFIHDIKSWGASFGASYRKQGDAFSRIVGEEVKTTYDGDLEMFVEKHFGDRFTLRFTGSNLLDVEKSEYFHKFLNAGDQTDRIYDEYEIERETSGPVFQVVGRYAF